MGGSFTWTLIHINQEVIWTLLKEKPLLETQMEVIRRGFATKEAVNHMQNCINKRLNGN